MLNKKVIWSEGTFLLPQHFQQQDRYTKHLINEYSKRPPRQDWGISRIELNRELMLQSKIGLNIAKGIFADGTFFNIPESDITPLPLNLSPGIVDIVIYLSLPIQREGIPETKIAGMDVDNKSYRYIGEFYEVSDNTTLDNSSTQLQLASLNITLKPSSEDLAGYNTIGIAKIKEIEQNGNIILDEDYIPPCLNFLSIPRGRSMIEEATGFLCQKGKSLSKLMNRDDQGNLPELQDFLLLQLINRYQPLLKHLLKTTYACPEEFYLLLIQLISELTTFTYDSADYDEFPQYDHNNLFEVFLSLLNSLESYLNSIAQPRSLKHPLEKHDQGIWVSRIENPLLFQDSIFILAVKAAVSDEQILSHFPSQIKISPAEDITNLVKYALSGLPLKFINSPPREIPFRKGFTYFELDKQSPLWERLETSSLLALHLTGHFPNIEMELWSVKV